MLLFLVISILCKNMTELGFWCCMVTGFFLGFFSNIVQLSFYGMINYFGQKTVSRFTVGTAVSGLSIMIVRAIITAGFGS
jgi:ABC-type Co2+ transport system permease subunit